MTLGRAWTGSRDRSEYCCGKIRWIAESSSQRIARVSGVIRHRHTPDRRAVGELFRHVGLERLTRLARIATPGIDEITALVPRCHIDGDGPQRRRSRRPAIKPKCWRNGSKSPGSPFAACSTTGPSTTCARPIPTASAAGTTSCHPIDPLANPLARYPLRRPTRHDARPSSH
jgi:hypothetical protein